MNKDNNYTPSQGLSKLDFPRVRVVMVKINEPGNIGAAARAMKNMCLSRLYLVNPKTFPSVVATARASGADSVLQDCVVCESLEEALTGCHLVIGASARQRSITWQQTDVMGACQMIEKTLMGGDNQQEVAIVFGTESSGLSNTELDLCQVLMSIPGNPNYFSLNVAQAVQVFAYHLFNQLNQVFSKTLKQTSEQKTSKQDLEAFETSNNTKNLASTDELNYFYQHLEKTLIDIEYMDTHRPNELLMRRLRKIFHRSKLQKDEVAIFRGILSKINKL